MPRKTYTEHFKRDAVSLYESTPIATITTISSDLGINRNSLRARLDAFGTGTKTNANGEKSPAPSPQQTAHAQPWKDSPILNASACQGRENAKLRQVREILRKAAKYFAEETNW